LHCCDRHRSILLLRKPPPAESGGVALNWNKIGWRVRVNFATLTHRIRPKDHIDLLRPMLPARY
jgi:putative restriction endonuclease